MTRRRSVEDWRREVYRSATLTDTAKVVLLFLSDRMRTNRQVSVPRSTIAQALAKSERGVTRRITEAHDKGFLDTVVAGRKHVTAVYEGTFPDVFSGTTPVPLKSAPSVPLRTPNQALSGTHGVPPIQERRSFSGPNRRDVDSDETLPDQPVRPDLTACTWHGWEPCPNDCANHQRSRRRTA